jgi:hypothetical protein
MPHYLVFFNQQWVGDHPAEWYDSRGPRARAVVEDMRAAGVLVFAGGLVEELDTAFSAEATSAGLSITTGPYRSTDEYLGGMTVIDVVDDEAAAMWAGNVAVACGWPQEVRRFKQ